MPILFTYFLRLFIFNLCQKRRKISLFDLFVFASHNEVRDLSILGAVFVCQSLHKTTAILSSYSYIFSRALFRHSGVLTCINWYTESSFYLFRTLVSQKEQYHFRSLHTTFVWALAKFVYLVVAQYSGLTDFCFFRLLFDYFFFGSSKFSLCRTHTHSSVRFCFGGDYIAKPVVSVKNIWAKRARRL